MKRCHLKIIALGLMLQSCCLPIQRDDPSYPQRVMGWNEYQDNGKLLGNFLLRKGESTSNGKFQVTLLDVVPGNPCSCGAELQHYARARLQFVRISDQRTMCNDLFSEHVSMGLSVTWCKSNLDDLGVSYIKVMEVNLKDGWVFFALG